MTVHTCHFIQQESTKILRCKNGWAFSYLNTHLLSNDANKITYLSDLSLDKKLLLVSQLYASQLMAKLVVLDGEKRVNYTGTIPEVNKSNILIKTKEGHINVTFKDILNIELVEEVQHESA